MKLILNILKWIGIILIALLLIIVILLLWLSKQPFVPTDYIEKVETGGTIESKYLEMGKYATKKIEIEAPEDWGKFIIYYPEELEINIQQYPVVVMVNGTGVYASKYPAIFEHLASWGFIVIGNEDPSTCTGDSSDATLTYILDENNNINSIFFQKVDIKHIGIVGHSQGGVGVFNAINEQNNKNKYTCAVSLSPTEWAMAEVLGLHYNPYDTTIPIMILAGSENDVITIDGVKGLFDAINAPTLTAIRENANHGEMLYHGDGYVTAWFMYYLQGDNEAKNAFFGENAEILNNKYYSNVYIK